MTPRDVILAWAQSGGFAALHNQGATDEAIVDDLLRWLEANQWALIRFRVDDYDPSAPIDEHNMPPALSDEEEDALLEEAYLYALEKDD